MQRVVTTLKSHRNVFLSLRMGVYDSPWPQPYQRASVPIAHGEEAGFVSPAEVIETPGIEVWIELTENLVDGPADCTHRGRLYLKGDGNNDFLRIDAKFAEGPKAIAKLTLEYSHYYNLYGKNVQGLVTVLGLHQCLRNKVLSLMLTFIHSGKPLPEVDHDVAAITRSQRLVNSHNNSF